MVGSIAIRSAFVALFFVLVTLCTSTADACSMGRIGFWTGGGPTRPTTNVIGIVESTTRNVAIVRVERYLQGSGKRKLTLSNRFMSYGAACRQHPWKGDRFSSGMRLALMLERDKSVAGADWRPAGFLAEGAFVINGDRSHASLETEWRFDTHALTTHLAGKGHLLAATIACPPLAESLCERRRGKRHWLHRHLGPIIGIGSAVLLLVILTTIFWLRQRRASSP